MENYDTTVWRDIEYDSSGKLKSDVSQLRNVGLVFYSVSDKPIRYSNPIGYLGWRNPSSYSRRFSEWQNWTGEVRQEWKYSNGWTPQGSLIRTFRPYPDANTMPIFDRSLPDMNTTGLVARAEVECLIKLKQQKVNLGVGLATAHQSISMIAKSLNQFGTALVAAKRGRWRSAAKSLGIPSHRFRSASKSSSDRWLELQYGWLPLLSDAHGYYEAAQAGFVRHGYRISAERTIMEKWEEDRTSGSQPVVRYSTDVRYGCKVRLDYTIKDDYLASAAMLGLTNPATIAWELLPWSFVVDWFFPIGNWLDSLDATLGLSFLGGSRTTFQRLQRFGVARETRTGNSGFDKFVFIHSLDGHFSSFSFSRGIYERSPVPIPYFKSPVSVGHGLNALALIRGLFK